MLSKTTYYWSRLLHLILVDRGKVGGMGCRNCHRTPACLAPVPRIGCRSGRSECHPLVFVFVLFLSLETGLPKQGLRTYLSLAGTVEVHAPYDRILF